MLVIFWRTRVLLYPAKQNRVKANTPPKIIQPKVAPFAVSIFSGYVIFNPPLTEKKMAPYVAVISPWMAVQNKKATK